MPTAADRCRSHASMPFNAPGPYFCAESVFCGYNLVWIQLRYSKAAKDSKPRALQSMPQTKP